MFFSSLAGKDMVRVEVPSGRNNDLEDKSGRSSNSDKITKQ